MSTFDLQCFHNEYLAEGQQEVNAIITVTAGGAAASSPAAGSAGALSTDGLSPGTAPAEIIIVDVSGSMEGTKIREARRATGAAIECIRDGARFAVIAGSHQARLAYPEGSLAVSSPKSRAEATAVVGRLKAGGGTAIGRWIDAAAFLLAGEAGVRHAILLTDGRDESETAQDLDQALGRAAGHFQCECRGVGSDWEVAELRRVAAALLGSVDIVADPSHLAGDFETMMRQSMSKSVADAVLRVWTPQGAEVQFLKQVAPEIVDLTASRRQVNEATGDYPTGAWGAESRDYHLAVRVRPGAVGDEMLAARVSVFVDGAVAGQALVQAIWTDDEVLSTRLNRQVAHYTGQQELADAIQDGLEARKNGDPDTAVVKLGRAVQLAAESDSKELAELLARVVEVEDATTGRVRLKGRVEAEDEMTLDTRSTRTSRVRR
jgi:hypothetical protein